MMLGQRDLRAKASMQCLFGLVNGPYFILFSRIDFNFKVVILGHPGLASHLAALARDPAARYVCRVVEHAEHARLARGASWLAAWRPRGSGRDHQSTHAEKYPINAKKAPDPACQQAN